MATERYRHDLLQRRVSEWGMNLKSLALRLGISLDELKTIIGGQAESLESVERVSSALGFKPHEVVPGLAPENAADRMEVASTPDRSGYWSDPNVVAESPDRAA